MSTVKVVNNKKRNHAEKVLQQMSKNLAPDNLVSPERVGLSSGKSTPVVELKDQYNVIREDIMKLREDLTRGYDLARDYVVKFDTKAFVMDMLKTR